ncbi:MAG: gluconokinase, GntK/IdnK-type [Pseudoxanthomonas sp.]
MSQGLQVVVVMGVSGSGKTTLARSLADACHATFLDADDFHSAAAKTRMAKGLPLSDRMRAPWVRRLRAELSDRTGKGERVVLAFSGLRREHRDSLRAGSFRLRFLFLHGEQVLIAARMQARAGHYMPASLLDSQFEALQDPRGEPDVFTLEIDTTPAELLARALALTSVGSGCMA